MTFTLLSWQNALVAISVASAVSSPVSVFGEVAESLDQVPNTHNLFGGDIETDYEQLKLAFGVPTAQQALRAHAVTPGKASNNHDDGERRLGASNGANLWYGATLIYVVDATYGSLNKDLVVLQNALNEITTKTGILFRERQGTSESYVRVIDGTGCSSYIGDVNNSGGGQPLKLKAPTAANGGTCRIQGIIAHEFLHALGLWHQQSTKDRDTYVRVDLQNVPSDYHGNFNTLSASNNWTPYDYGSVMHYGKLAFSSDTSSSAPLVLTAIDSNGQANSANTAKMGQRTALSVTDAIELQIMYHCHLANPTVARNPPANIEDLCSADCPCAKGQGGCSSDDQCQDGLYCANNVGVYEHLNQVMTVPGLNACLQAAKAPTQKATKNPTRGPTKVPTAGPTKAPTRSPTRAPTKNPTPGPTKAPTRSPTRAPSSAPTKAPSKIPTSEPTTNTPTRFPTKTPTESPTTLAKLPAAPQTAMPTFAPTSLTAVPTPMSATTTSKELAEDAARRDEEQETMHITIAIAAGCFAALVAVGVVVINKNRKSKFGLGNNSSPRGGKAAGQLSPDVGVGGVSTFNPSFTGMAPSGQAQV